MKKIVLSLIILFPIFLSCEKIFHKEDYVVARIENIGELEQAVSAVNGLLGRAYNSWYGNGFYAANLKGDDLNAGYPGYPSDADDSECVEDHYWGVDFSWYDYEEIYNEDLWGNLYKVIVSANNIITQFPNPRSYEKDYRELIGEAYFLRAYSYFRLVRTYEEVLLIDDIDINFTQSASSPKVIYEFIEQDLNESIILLPGNREQSRIPGATPHRGSAKAFLAEVYLNWAGFPVLEQEKYTLSAQLAGEVIDSAGYFGFALLPDFATLWDHSDYYNHESIFALHFSDPLQTSIIEEVNQVYDGYYEINGHFNFKLDLHSSVEIHYFPSELNFFNTYPQGYRKDITFFTCIFIETGYDFENNIPIGYFDTINYVRPCSRIAYRKFYYAADVLNLDHFEERYQFYDYFLGSSKVYLFRYAHTLLTYAEASARSGILDEKVFECVNQIRRRAHHVDLYSPSVYDLTPGLSNEIFADSIVWERAWELAGEPEGRWFDLVRLEMVEELLQLRHPQEGGWPTSSITKEDYFLSIPEDDQFLNPNLEE